MLILNPEELLQTILVSATLDDKVKQLASTALNNALLISGISLLALLVQKYKVKQLASTALNNALLISGILIAG
jgi:hypothetical protein